MSKKKICFIAQFPPPIHGLSKAVQTLYDSELADEYELEKINITSNRCFPQNIWRVLRSDADLFYFTISQTKGGNLRDLIIMKLLSLQKKRCMIHLHGGYYRQLVDNDLSSWQRKANYKAVGRLDGAIVLGESLKNIFQGLLSDEKIFIVPNCIDDEYLIGNDEFEEKVNALNNKQIKHVLYLSNFIRSKGYAEVLEMARLEKERCNSGEGKLFHFDFAGKFFEKEEEDFFFTYIKEHELNDYVTYHGVVSGEKKRELLKLCDVFALLTRYPNEGQPISILEAMGNGMIVVTTDHAGIPDVVTDGVNGIMINKENIDVYALSNYLLTGIEEQTIRNNRCRVIREHSEKQYIENIRKCWESI